MNSKENIDWAEQLPSNCPPNEATTPNGKCFFRRVSAYPPNESDFHSHRALYPKKKFDNECIARSVSLFSDLNACLNLGKLPHLKRKPCIVRLILDSHSGRVMKTGKKHHYSWWRVINYEPIAECKLVMEDV